MNCLETDKLNDQQPQSACHSTDEGDYGQKLRCLTIGNDPETPLETVLRSPHDKKQKMENAAGEEEIDNNKDRGKQDNGQKHEIQSKFTKKAAAETINPQSVSAA